MERFKSVTIKPSKSISLPASNLAAPQAHVLDSVGHISSTVTKQVLPDSAILSYPVPQSHWNLTTSLLPISNLPCPNPASKPPIFSSLCYPTARIVQGRYLTMAPSAVIPQPLDFSNVDLKVPKSTFNDSTSPNSIGTKRKIICFSGT